MLLTPRTVHTQILLNNLHKSHLRESSWKMILLQMQLINLVTLKHRQMTGLRE